MARQLTPGSNRGNAQKFIVSGIRLGLSNTEIYNQLVAGGLGYLRGYFEQDLARLRANPLPRQVPIESQFNEVNFTGYPVRLLSKGQRRFRYVFEARTRNSRGQFNGGTLTWSFTSPHRMIPSIANAIGVAIAPDVGQERYNSLVPPDTIPIQLHDIYAYTDPEELLGSSVSINNAP